MKKNPLISDDEFLSDIKEIYRRYKAGKISRKQAADCILSEIKIYLSGL